MRWLVGAISVCVWGGSAWAQPAPPALAEVAAQGVSAVVDAVVADPPRWQARHRRRTLRAALGPRFDEPVRCTQLARCPAPQTSLGEALLTWLGEQPARKAWMLAKQSAEDGRARRRWRVRTIARFDPTQRPQPSSDRGRDALRALSPVFDAVWAAAKAHGDPTGELPLELADVLDPLADQAEALRRAHPCNAADRGCSALRGLAWEPRGLAKAPARERWYGRAVQTQRAALLQALAQWIEAGHLSRPSGGSVAAPAVGCQIAGRRLALVVGIDRYAPGIAPLRGARRDAERMAAALEARGYAVTRLLDEQATLAAIRTHLGDRLRQRARAGDQVLVYFAGHGITVGPAHAAQGYLLPVDAPSAGVAGALAMREVVDLLGTYAAEHRVFLADACYAGLAASGTRRVVRADEPVGCTTATQQPATVVLVAGGRDELAHETEAGGVFTSAVIDALSGAAPGAADGWISHLHLAAHVTAVVPAQVKARWKRRQTPQLGRVGEGVVHLPVAPPAP